MITPTAEVDLRPKSEAVPVWAAVALFAAGLAAGGVGAVLVTGRGVDDRETSAVPADRQPPANVRRFTRDEFRAAVMGRTPNEVIAAVGRPQSTGDGADGEQSWYYGDATVDPVTGNPDRFTFVVFRGGRVVGVHF
jgi:hypothetical protein